MSLDINESVSRGMKRDSSHKCGIQHTGFVEKGDKCLLRDVYRYLISENATSPLGWGD